MYFGGHISSQREFILLCGSEYAMVEVANNRSYYLSVWQDA
jgi:hypothetical protein